MTQHEDGKLTIAMTGSQSVRIVEDDWPILSQATFDGVDTSLTVRRHPDERILVYYADGRISRGVLIERSPIGIADLASTPPGKFLPVPIDDIIAVITEVVRNEDASPELAQMCIDGLPPKDI